MRSRGFREPNLRTSPSGDADRSRRATLEFRGSWFTWGDLAAAADAVDEALSARGLGAGDPVGIMLRNRPAALGTLFGVLRAGACVVTVNPLLGGARLREDIPGLGLPLLLGEPEDLADLSDGVLPATSCGAFTELGRSIALTPSREASSANTEPGVAVRMLTSGTTGPPKRINLTYRMLEVVMRGAKHYESSADEDVRLRSGVVICNAPLVHLSGVFRTLQALLDGRRIALLEQFNVPEWLDLVQRHHPKTVSLVPTALRMVLDADVDPQVFDGVRSVISGTARTGSRPGRSVHPTLRSPGVELGTRRPSSAVAWRDGTLPTTSSLLR